MKNNFHTQMMSKFSHKNRHLKPSSKTAYKHESSRSTENYKMPVACTFMRR